MIIFSSFTPFQKDLGILEEFLSLVEKNYKNDHVFIGIQKDSCADTIPFLSKYKNLNLHYDVINPSTYINSDVCGFQKAIELYYNSDKELTKEDKFVYFGHTKGVTTGNYKFREYMFNKHFNDREHIETKLAPENCGAFGHILSPINSPNDTPYSKVLTKWNKKLKCTTLNYFFMYTFYVCKKNILDEFLKDLEYNFFTDNLLDRYFFERDFIHFVDMLGYEPVYNIIEGNNSWHFKTPDESDHLRILGKWRTENNIIR